MLDKDIYDFFKECEDIKNCIGGCVMVAKNETTGYGCNGIFQIIETNNGFKLIKESEGVVNKQNFNFEDIMFNKNTIKKIELDSKFGRYANVYLDRHNYIHVHICLLD